VVPDRGSEVGDGLLELLLLPEPLPKRLEARLYRRLVRRRHVRYQFRDEIWSPSCRGAEGIGCVRVAAPEAEYY
jgi:hypothetical protein